MDQSTSHDESFNIKDMDTSIIKTDYSNSSQSSVESNGQSKPKKMRGNGINYSHYKKFSSEEERRKFWTENGFDESYKIDKKGNTKKITYKRYHCVFFRKSGFQRCLNQLLVTYPNDSTNVVVYEANEHNHEPETRTKKEGNFSWLKSPELNEIVAKGIEFKAKPSVILQNIYKSRHTPFPTKRQVYNHIRAMRVKLGQKKKIDTDSKLWEFVKCHDKVPEDIHQPYCNRYAIKTDDEKEKVKFALNLTTKNLEALAEDCPFSLIQMDPTYKLIEGEKIVMIHGTSNSNHDFSATGLVVSSNQDHETFGIVLDAMGIDENSVVLGDGTTALTKAIQEYMSDGPTYNIPTYSLPKEDEEEYEEQPVYKEIKSNRIMCYVHVLSNIQNNCPVEHKDEIKEDIMTIQSAASREEFDNANKEFVKKWSQLREAVK
jgi:hypothetical protein